MNVFSIIMTAFLATSLFQAEIPKHETYANKSPEEVVQLFHKNCQAFINLPKFQRPGGKGSRIHRIIKRIREARKSGLEKGEGDIFLKSLNGSKSLGKFSKLLAPQVEKLLAFYDDICLNPTPKAYEKYDLKLATQLFDKISKELPDHNVFDQSLPQMTLVQDRDGNVLNHLHSDQNRRLWVDINDIPDFLQKAFVAIEDQNFFNHQGIDQTGLVRAFLSSMSGRLQGGSSITQQLAKNLFFQKDLVQESITKDPFVKMRRKIKEIIITSRIEQSLKDKKRILGYYLNLIYLGRTSWGVRAASQIYFGRELDQLNTSEMAFLAALPRGPNNYEPMLFKKRALARRDLVIDAMVRAKFIKSKEEGEAIKKIEPRFIEYKMPYKALYVTDYLRKETEKLTGIKSLTEDHYTVKSTIHGKLQTVVESALQKGLINFEKKSGQQKWNGPLKNIARFLDQKDTDGKSLPWNMVFKIRGHKYENVHYKVAIILKRAGAKATLGFLDGKKGQLALTKTHLKRIIRYHQTYKKKYKKGRRTSGLQYGDIVYVEKSKKKNYRLVFTPSLQGAAMVMDVHTGEVLAMTGGFSYHQAPFNRATLGKTHPGSTLKPFTYMLALDEGYQPNTLIPNGKYYGEGHIKIKKAKHRRCAQDSKCVLVNSKPGCAPWPVRNYSLNTSEPQTMRRCLENSRNLCIANLIQLFPEGQANTFQAVRETLLDFKVYDKPGNCYPLLLGGQATSLLRMVRAYAAIANGGILREPKLYKTITGNLSGVIEPLNEQKKIDSVKKESLIQLRHIMQGVLARGTAVRAKKLSNFVAGKTGTSDNYRSAWFMGFSKDIVVGVYIAHDHSKGLGKLGTGGKAALPIAQEIFSKSSVYKKLEPFPSQFDGLHYANINYKSGVPGGSFREIFRTGADTNPGQLLGSDYVSPRQTPAVQTEERDDERWWLQQDVEREEEPWYQDSDSDQWSPNRRRRDQDELPYRQPPIEPYQPESDGQYESDPSVNQRQLDRDRRREKRLRQQEEDWWRPFNQD